MRDPFRFALWQYQSLYSQESSSKYGWPSDIESSSGLQRISASLLASGSILVGPRFLREPRHRPLWWWEDCGYYSLRLFRNLWFPCWKPSARLPSYSWRALLLVICYAMASTVSNVFVGYYLLTGCQQLFLPLCAWKHHLFLFDHQLSIFSNWGPRSGPKVNPRKMSNPANPVSLFAIRISVWNSIKKSLSLGTYYMLTLQVEPSLSIWDFRELIN